MATPLSFGKRLYNKAAVRILIVSLLFTGLMPQVLQAQALLEKPITVTVTQQRLADVLEIISNQGNFYFSYNSNIVRRDSLVTLNARNRTVKQLLESLFPGPYEFRESGQYIIIRRRPLQLTLQTGPAKVEEKYYSISGFVTDADNGARLPETSVYEKEQLATSLTNEEGYFTLKLKSRFPQAALTVSKEYYYDTTVAIQTGQNQQVDVWLMPIETSVSTISPEDYLLPDSVSEVKQQPLPDTAVSRQPDSTNVDKRFLGRLLISSKQKIQSLNMGNFFATRPFQFSLVPGLGTHGKMSGQVVNHFSMNLLGGYNGGLEGFEVAGLFNINRKNAGYFQASGLFNVTGGKQSGFQAAGISNTTLGDLAGFSAAGVSNYSGGGVKGVQVAGVYSHSHLEVHGVQIAGVANYSRRNLHGAQIAGVFNFADTVSGAQIGGVVNYTNHSRGLQIGLINIADTSDGYSIGLINFVRKGYHNIYLGTDETMDLTLGLKSGNHKLYSIFLGGINLDQDKKLYSFGYGLGREWITTRAFALSTDLSSQYLYLGSWDYLNLLNRFTLYLHLRLGKGFALYGGPSFNMYYSDQPLAVAGYQFEVPRSGYWPFTVDNYWRGWAGWQAGIRLF